MCQYTQNDTHTLYLICIIKAKMFLFEHKTSVGDIYIEQLQRTLETNNVINSLIFFSLCMLNLPLLIMEDFL